MKIPTIISLFAGCGGSSLGYRMAGFKELLAIDWDKIAIETFKLNFPDVPIWQRDIRELKGDEILKFCKIKKRELDVLDGSPPCQGFSTAGKRKVADARNDLFKHNIRLINEVQPKVFVIENVSGMIKGKMKGLFKEYMRELKKLDYNVRCKLLNAKWYGVPQSRERLIWIGVNKNIKYELKDIYPMPSKKTINVKDALSELYFQKHPHNSNEFILNIMKDVPPGRNGSIVKGKGRYFDSIRLHAERPANTIKRSFRIGMNAYFHPEQDRNLTISEIKRLQTFPDDFNFIGTFKQQWAQIGNSVPPFMMKAIAKTIKMEILGNDQTQG